MKIYLVTAFGGQWEDKWESPEKAFTTLEAAQKYKEQKEQKRKAWEEKAERILSEWGGKELVYHCHCLDIRIELEDGVSGWRIEEIEMEQSHDI